MMHKSSFENISKSNYFDELSIVGYTFRLGIGTFSMFVLELLVLLLPIIAQLSQLTTD